MGEVALFVCWFVGVFLGWEGKLEEVFCWLVCSFFGGVGLIMGQVYAWAWLCMYMGG